jgi:hypothetical protein
VELYHEILPELPPCTSWDTPEHQSKTRARWRYAYEKLKREGKPHEAADVLAFFRRYFTYVRGSPFLMGQTEGRAGKPFTCTLGWLIGPQNFAKVIDQTYHEKRP